MKPLLKWAGGKARMVDQISAAFTGPCDGTWIEPFLGSGAVYLHLKAKGLIRRAVLGDANDKLVSVHVAVRDRVEEVLTELSALPTDDWRERYYDVRESYNHGPHDGPAHAARFLWLNRAGFNGLYRENRLGRFNVPIGSYSSLNLPTSDHFRAVSALLQDAEIRTARFDELLRLADEGDHVYCDPPYVPLSETASFTGYCSLPFGLTEQHHLAQEARRAAMKGATVVLSNHDTAVVRDDLYPTSGGFRHVSRPRIARSISRGVRGTAPEVIAAIGPLRRGAA